LKRQPVVKFDSTLLRGMLSIEDLFDLPLSGKSGSANLDDMIKDLYQKLKAGNEISFVTKKTEVDSTTQLKFDLIKHVIDVRLAESEAADNMAANKLKKQQLMQILADMENKALLNKTPEEIQKMIQEM